MVSKLVQLQVELLNAKFLQCDSDSIIESSVVAYFIVCEFVLHSWSHFGGQRHARFLWNIFTLYALKSLAPKSSDNLLDNNV